MSWFLSTIDVVGKHIVVFCREVFETGKLPHNINYTHIVLIPKKPKLESMKDLRLIALSNVVYKIFTKLLANRLKFILPFIISNF